ncbi:AAEL012666-PA [Gryllus bimaculatus]|nr:AAEL012666-PA [Gryllus bimaculatus]
MDKHQVVPDVIDKAPAEVAEVTFKSGAKAELGNELTPTQVKDIPVVVWKAEQSSLYTLCMTDPDAPSRKDPRNREWHHWLVVNIPGNEIAKGDTLTEYVGAGPPKDSGLHRYVILLYKQPNKIRASEPHISKTTGKNRGKFSIRKFAKKYKLTDIVAGNFFQAQWDEYVPKLYKQLSG